MQDAVLTQSRNWAARLDLDFVRSGERTRMLPRQRFGPLSVQRPFYPEAGRCHVYLLHPPGGVVGGDILTLNIVAGKDSASLMTTPGATKYYYSAADTALVEQNIQACANSRVDFLPLENIYFPGAIAQIDTTVQVEDSAVVMLWEKHCFGRPANHEIFSDGEIITRLQIRHNDELVYHERQRFDPQEITRSSGLRSWPVAGTFAVYGINISQQLSRELNDIKPLRGTAGVTCPDDKLLLARYIGPDTETLDRYFVSLWKKLRLLADGIEPVQPRIWAT